MDMEQHMYKRLYAAAKRPEDLPWHQDQPWAMLRRVVEARGRGGRALDLGCGAGGFSIYLAQRGYSVTGIDYLAAPLRMAAQQSRAAGVTLHLIQANVLEWETSAQFDLILDSGCLHSLGPASRARYRARLLGWLAPDGDYVLAHFAKLHPFDWRPMGPRRKPRRAIVAELAPELREQDYAEELQVGVALPVGPRCLMGEYWFRRA